jgi:tRNA(fMet)-specific endonuclease VapC
MVLPKARRRKHHEKKQEKFLRPYATLPFDNAAAKVFGRIRAELEQQGLPIGPYDLQIAAIAMVHDLIVVTHNLKEFERIKDLKIEDWEIE